MNEAELQTRFTKWLKGDEGKAFLFEGGGAGAAAFELKYTAGVALALNEFAEHQIQALSSVEGLDGTGTMVHKISDSAIGYKPFDCFAMAHAPGYGVIGFGGVRPKTRGRVVALCLSIRVIRPLYAFKKKTGMRGGGIAYSAFKSLGRVIEL